jgi:proton-translocating NADH-quinone oxidoreductase chain M
MNLLAWILALPLFTIIGIFVFSNIDVKKIHNIALISSALSFTLSVILWILMDQTNADFQFQFSLYLIPSVKFYLTFGVDGISIFFILLTNLFIYLCILSLPLEQKKMYEVLMYLFLLQWGVLAAFCVLDLLGFFIFFEATLIPIYFIVLIWGSRERKIRASYMISLYTLFGSIFMFFNIIYIFSKIGVTNYQFLLTVDFSKEDQNFLWLTFFIAFATKIPLFPVHIWLPEAHVEAPTIGSVLLAVLLLKLGTYGLIRFSLPLFPYSTLVYAPLVNTFAIAGIIYTSLTAIRQVDLKKIIAYSSVGHMNAVLLGIISLNTENLEGAIFQMLSHGIVSGALFFCVGSFYKRYKVRSLHYFGGFMSTYPLLSIFFMIFSMANISFPGTSSFVGEFMIFLGLFGNNSIVVALASLNMIIGAVYTLWSYNRIAFGNIKNLTIKKHLDLDRSEFYLFAILTVMLFLMGIFSDIILDNFHVSCSNLIEHAKLQLN